MHTIEAVATIDRPLDVVWDAIVDPVLLPRWFSGVHRVELDSADPIRKGSRYREVIWVAGRRLELTIEVTEFDLYRVFGTRVVEGPFEAEALFRIQPLDDTTTRVVWQGRSPDIEGVFGRIAEGAILHHQEKLRRADLHGLKLLLEGDAL